MRNVTFLRGLSLTRILLICINRYLGSPLQGAIGCKCQEPHFRQVVEYHMRLCFDGPRSYRMVSQGGA